MSRVAVLFDHVSKKYRRGERHDSLRDAIPALAATARSLVQLLTKASACARICSSDSAISRSSSAAASGRLGVIRSASGMSVSRTACTAFRA